MESYKLNALLKLRQLEKENAERHLSVMHQELEEEQKKLLFIQTQLIRKKNNRTQMQDNFFHKAIKSPPNNQQLQCLAISSQKNIYDESTLINLLNNQLTSVNEAKIRCDKASSDAIQAHQDLKVIKKHFSCWQEEKKRREELNLQNYADDLNNTRFSLKKRV
jgi:hypothetical protein